MVEDTLDVADVESVVDAVVDTDVVPVELIDVVAVELSVDVIDDDPVVDDAAVLITHGGVFNLTRR